MCIAIPIIMQWTLTNPKSMGLVGASTLQINKTVMNIIKVGENPLKFCIRGVQISKGLIDSTNFTHFNRKFGGPTLQ